MNKKLLLGFVAVFIAVMLIEYFVNMVLMTSDYQQTAQLWRPQAELKMGVIILCQLFFSFFFTFIFSRGYEGKGVMEGLRYGLYVSLMMNIPAAYITYATMPVPYSLALKWFLYGTVEYLILGAIVALVFGRKEAAAAEPRRTMEHAS